MKMITYGLASALALALSTARAVITLGYPGPPLEDGTAPIIEVEGETAVKSGVFKLVIGPFYKFTFTGIETYGNVPGGEDVGGGNPIHFSAIIKVDGPGPSDQNPQGTADSEYESVSAYNSSERLYTLLDEEIVYRAGGTEPLYLEVTWSSQVQGGNSSKAVTPDGHFNIMGYAQADPLPPSGSLNIPTGAFALEGSFPTLVATIVRE